VAAELSGGVEAAWASELPASSSPTALDAALLAGSRGCGVAARGSEAAGSAVGSSFFHPTMHETRSSSSSSSDSASGTNLHVEWVCSLEKWSR